MIRAPSLLCALAPLYVASAVTAQSLPTEISALRAAGFEENSRENQAFQDDWGIPIYWGEIDLDAAQVVWLGDDGDLVVADATLLMMAPPDGPATWGWAVEAPKLPLSPTLDLLVAHGQTHGITELTTAHIDLPAASASLLADPATLYDGVDGVFMRAVRGHDALFVVAYGTPRRKEASP